MSFAGSSSSVVRQALLSTIRGRPLIHGVCTGCQLTTARRPAFPSRSVQVSNLHTSSPSLSTPTPKKPSISSIGELRKLVPGTSMLKAREALLASRSPSSPDEDDVHAAVAWLDADRQAQGAKKAAKVGSRRAGEGLVCVCVLHDGLPQSLALPKGVGEKMVVKEEAQGAGMTLDSPPQAAIVEVNCETDFVGKNVIFQDLVRDLAHTAAMFPALAGTMSDTSANTALQEIDVKDLLAFPLFSSSPDSSSSSMPKLVSEAIIDAISRLGENIILSRACALNPTASLSDRSDRTMRIVSSFGHGGSTSAAGSSSGPNAIQAAQGYSMTMGKVGSLLLTQFPRAASSGSAAIESAVAGKAIRGLTRSLARQAAGMKTTGISSSDTTADMQADETSEVLYRQPFVMLLPAARPSVTQGEEGTSIENGQAVGAVLRAWSQAMYSKENASEEVQVRVEEMRRWELGETLEAKEESGSDFAEEVRRAAGLA